MQKSHENAGGGGSDPAWLVGLDKRRFPGVVIFKLSLGTRVDISPE